MGVYENVNGELKLISGATLYADSPIGTIVAYGGATAPKGWLLCQGQAISRTDYKELFAAIGTAYGAGDGSTTFNVPDGREAVLVGAGQSDRAAIATHDVYDVGEFKDDQLQNLTGEYGWVSATDSSQHFNVVTGNSKTDGVFKKGTSNGVKATFGASGGTYSGNDLAFDASLVARTGETTHGKQLGANYIIKAQQVALPADLEDKIDNEVEEAVVNHTKRIHLHFLKNAKLNETIDLTEIIGDESFNKYGVKVTMFANTYSTISNHSLYREYILRNGYPDMLTVTDEIVTKGSDSLLTLAFTLNDTTKTLEVVSEEKITTTNFVIELI